MTIRCTQKMFKEVGISGRQLDEPGEGFLGSWFANLFWLGRRKCVIFANDRTLYAFVLLGYARSDSADLGRRVVAGLTDSLMNEGVPVERVASIGMACHPIRWGATNSRSVLGSANDLILQCRSLLAGPGGEAKQKVAWLNGALNRIPMGAIGYKYAIDRPDEALQG